MIEKNKNKTFNTSGRTAMSNLKPYFLRCQIGIVRVSIT